MVAPIGTLAHVRSAATLSVVADYESFNGGEPVPPTDLYPFSALGPLEKGYSTRNLRKLVTPVAPIPMHVVPKPGRILYPSELDAMDYIMKAMFIFSTQPWTNSIASALSSKVFVVSLKADRRHTAANAAIMAKKLEDKGQAIPESTTPRQMTSEQWVNLARCYDAWPFKPRVSFFPGLTCLWSLTCRAAQSYETDFEDRNAEFSMTMEGHKARDDTEVTEPDEET